MPPIMHTPNTAPQPGPCRPLCNVIITSCSAAPPGNCSGPHKFKCGSGECKLIRFRCNGHNQCDDGSDENNCCKLMVVVTVVVVVVGQSNTLKSNVLGNFFLLRVLRFLNLPVHDGQVEPCSRTFWGWTSGGVYVPCIYTHVRWVTAGDSGLCCCAFMTSLVLCVDVAESTSIRRVLFVCCFCFFALQNDDFWYWS